MKKKKNIEHRVIGMGKSQKRKPNGQQMYNEMFKLTSTEEMQILRYHFTLSSRTKESGGLCPERNGLEWK